MSINELGSSNNARKRGFIRGLSPFIPYVTVLVGMYVTHSVWVAAIAYHVVAGAVLWGDRNRMPEQIALKPDSGALFGLNALIGLSTGVLLYALWPLLGVPKDIGARLGQLGLTSWLGFGIYYCSVNPLIEELFWRRYLETPSSFPARNDILFAGYHMLVLALFVDWKWLLAAFGLLVLASWIWGHTARTRKGILVITASHLLADLGIIIAGSMHGR